VQLFVAIKAYQFITFRQALHSPGGQLLCFALFVHV
jgi:hypothetical protein